MCLLLPDVEYSAAPGTLIGVQGTLIQVVPVLVRDLEPESTFPDPNLANSSALPLILLEAVIFELLDRAGTKMGTAAVRRPSPSDSLTDARRFNTERITEGGAPTATITPRLRTLLGDTLRRLIVESIPNQESHGRAQEWTGWALLAAMHSMETYDHRLPVPGRTLRDANTIGTYRAFDLGRRIAIAAALDLIDQAERDTSTTP